MKFCGLVAVQLSASVWNLQDLVLRPCSGYWEIRYSQWLGNSALSPFSSEWEIQYYLPFSVPSLFLFSPSFLLFRVLRMASFRCPAGGVTNFTVCVGLFWIRAKYRPTFILKGTGNIYLTSGVGVRISPARGMKVTNGLVLTPTIPLFVINILCSRSVSN